MTKIAIMGGGSFGTALAIVLARASRPHGLALWARSADIVRMLSAGRVNEVYLPGFELPPVVQVTGSMGEALAEADIVLGAMPSAHAREVYRAMRPHMPARACVVSGTKGLEPASHARTSEIIAAELAAEPGGDPGSGLGAAPQDRIAVLSGPSFALEIARGDPTAVVIASSSAALASRIQEEFSGPTLRLYTNDDVVGAEIAGAVKNVIAIASGICVGIGFGSNTTAALVTRGLAEMTRLAVALGGRRDTLAGLAGAGDLILTSMGALSRNRTVGVELGKGRPLDEILGATRMVAEGVGTAAAALDLARGVGVEMPIAQQVHAILTAGRATRDAIRHLMDRPLTQE